MKKILMALLLTMPMVASAQSNVTTNNDRIAALKAEAEAKAKAAQEALKAAQEAEEAARLALEQAEKEAAEAKAREEADRIAKEEAEAQSAIAEAERIAREAEEQAAAAKARAEEMKARAEQLKNQTPVATQPKETKNEEAPLWTTAIGNEEQTKTRAKKNKDENLSIYLAADAVPEVNGMVRWTHDINVPGKTAEQIYERTLAIIEAITKDDNQLEWSKVAIANKEEHTIMATMQEWLVFTSNAIMLDRTKLNYVLQAKCSNGHVQVIMDHVTYNYDVQGDKSTFKAEEWINDKNAVNKKRTRLFPNSGKFRRKTIDRKNAIFNTIEKQLQ